MQQTNELTPPDFCVYSKGPCDQNFPKTRNSAFFIYPSHPPHLASTFRDAANQLKQHGSTSAYLTWEDLNIGGQIVFCEICKAIRKSDLVIANITNTNFNVFFEIGYAIGCGKPVLPIRDTTYEKENKLIEEIGIFDTLGYKNFSNSRDVVSLANAGVDSLPPIVREPKQNRQQPIYFIRSPIDTDGSIKLFSSLKKCYFRFRTFDQREIPRLSLHEAFQQVFSSIAVVAHLLDPERKHATSHNARAAFVCGMAMAAKKHVLMLQEGFTPQPIDYRDVVVPYEDVASIPINVERIVRATAETFQSSVPATVKAPMGLLERIDMGDVAAENEIQSLSSYFVKTPQFQQTRQGHARLVVGRKGAGKTAIFYSVRRHLFQEKNLVVLDLKPEGHQFTRLREMVLDRLGEGLQQHTLTAFWHYLLLLEVTIKLLEREVREAWRSPETVEKYNDFKQAFEKHQHREGDFSERLMALVDRIIERFPDKPSSEISSPEITKMIYKHDINVLNAKIVEHLECADGLWILFDNIDKGFPTKGLKAADVFIIQCLLEATRKLQRSLEKKGIECVSTIFIRRDVYDNLVDRTPDRGKESSANLDWSDIELVKELLLRRFKYEVEELGGRSFNEAWTMLFDPHVGGESSFEYITSRTFNRPRDVLNFVRKCIQVAVSRKHSIVEQEDILKAEEGFSVDMLNELRYEIRDVYPSFPNILDDFFNSSIRLSTEDISLLFMEQSIPEEKIEEIRNILLWFSFLGIIEGSEEWYSYKVAYQLPTILSRLRDIRDKDEVFMIHPAFRKALSI